jgi:hypothetical protein
VILAALLLSSYLARKSNSSNPNSSFVFEPTSGSLHLLISIINNYNALGIA